MQLFYEIFPVLLFFLAFKFYNIYVATVVGIGATLLQVIFTRLVAAKWDKKQLITLGVFVIFGGMTLYFHNPIFIKWKPTIVFGIFALVTFGSQIFTQKPIMQRVMEQAFSGKESIPRVVWRRVNLIWGVFFMCLAAINLYIAYYFSNDAWVNFKFYGVTGALFLVSILQALYLLRFVSDDKVKK